jgi:hypothetical protein
MATSKARKAPADRQPKAEKKIRPEDVKGWHLLKSIDEVPVWDQAPLMSLVQSLIGDAKEGDEIQVAMDAAILGDIAKAMIPWAKDEAEFTKFCTGRTALQDVANLAMAWTSVLGEEVSSGDS